MFLKRLWETDRDLLITAMLIWAVIVLSSLGLVRLYTIPKDIFLQVFIALFAALFLITSLISIAFGSKVLKKAEKFGYERVLSTHLKSPLFWSLIGILVSVFYLGSEWSFSLKILSMSVDFSLAHIVIAILFYTVLSSFEAFITLYDFAYAKTKNQKAGK